MKTAYIVLAHRNPRQLARLVRALDDGSARFFVHFDKGSGDAAFGQVKEALASVPRVIYLPRRPCLWGDFSLVEASLDGLRAAMEAGSGGDSFTHAVLLSGQDYPIQPISIIRETLASLGEKSLLTYWPLPYSGWPDGGWGRIERYHFHLGALLRRRFYGRFLREAPLAALLRRLPIKRRFPDGFVPYGGHQWWILSREAARFVLDFVLRRPDFVRFFRRAYIPDELFFQTLLLNSSLRETLEARPWRFERWNPVQQHPEVLTEAHFAQIAASPLLFARKFDEGTDVRILDRIDADILTRGGG